MTPDTPYADGREPGKPAPGHRRRTNAQITEDDAYFKTKARGEAALRAAEVGVHEDAKSLAPLDASAEAETEESIFAEPAAISTGEARVNPEDVADEAAESAQRLTAGPTLDDLRAAVGVYTKAQGIPAAQAAIPSIIGYPIPETPADQIAGAIERILKAAVEPPLRASQKFEPIKDAAPDETIAPATASIEPAPTATLQDIQIECVRYGRTFDHVTDPKLMKFALEDIPKLLVNEWPEATGLAKIPPSPENYGRAVAIIKSAIVNNPFKR